MNSLQNKPILFYNLRHPNNSQILFPYNFQLTLNKNMEFMTFLFGNTIVVKREFQSKCTPTLLVLDSTFPRLQWHSYYFSFPFPCPSLVRVSPCSSNMGILSKEIKLNNSNA
ncbi:hypothetical protein ACOSQ3_016517 [Xanthoceras sorbifolium]